MARPPLPGFLRARHASRAFADTCRREAPDAPVVQVGLEHEFLCTDSTGGRVDYRTVIDALGLGRRHLVPHEPFAYRLPSGSVVTADGTEAEVATPPVAVAAGFAARLDGWAAWERERLEEQVAPMVLTGDSTHLNVTMPPDVDGDSVANLFATRFAVGQMLLMDRRTSPGLLVRPRPHRLELGGEYVVGSALRASAAYAVGATLACVDAIRRGNTDALPPALTVRLERNVLRYGWYIARTAFGGDLYSGGRSLALRGVDGSILTAGASLAAGWEVACRHLAALVTPDDLRDADDLIAGLRALPSERDRDVMPAHLSTAVEPRSPYGEALAARGRPGYELAPVMLTWELAVFLVAATDRRRSAFAAVPAAYLGGFLAALASGSLDAPLRDYLGSRFARRRLLERTQLHAPGLFDALGLRVALLAPERDLSGRIVHLRTLVGRQAGRTLDQAA